MKLFNIRKAFSLTELLIVLVVVAILFAAMAPIMTKRGKGSTTAQEPVWMFVKNDDYKDAYYDSGLVNKTSTAFVGVNPESLTNNYKPWSKVIVKSIPLQNTIQFRYGSGNGTLSGIFFIDNKGNILNGSRLKSGKKNKNYNDVFQNSDTKYNTVMGADAFSEVNKKGAIGATSIGAFTTVYDDIGNNGNGSEPSYSTVVGASSGSNTKANNTFAGSLVGTGSGIVDTVAVGSGILSTDLSAGSNNVILGSNVATAGMKGDKYTRNTIIGPNLYKAEFPVDATIVGVNSYAGGGEASNAMTAVGYYACSSFANSTDKGSRTCIGHSSGWASGHGTPLSHNVDGYDHIYLGGAPQGGFPGRAALEVHNIKDTPALAAPHIGPSVVLNTNLVVRGDFYFPNNSGVLAPHIYSPSAPGKDVVNNRDWCTKGCRIFGRRSWRNKDGCNILEIVLKVVVWTVAIVGSILSGGALDAILALGAWAGLGNFMANMIPGPSSDYRKIQQEPLTSSAKVYVNDKGLSSCSNSSSCPQLKVKLSDIRLKDNITENTDALDTILMARIYNYTYKKDEKLTPQVGVMAQDLLKYLPNAVSKDKDGYLTIRLDELFYANINSIKALDNTLSTVEDKITAVEKDVADLKMKHKMLNDKVNRLNTRLDKLEK